MTRTTSGAEGTPRSRLYRWIWSVLVLSLVILGLVAWRVLFVHRATVTATLLVASVPPSVLVEPKGDGVDATTYRKTAVALIKHPAVLARAASAAEARELATVRRLASRDVDLAAWLARNLSASFRDGSEVLEVSLSGDNPKDLAVLVNAVVDSYISMFVKPDNDARLARLDLLKEASARYQRELKVKRAALKAVAAAASSGEAAAAPAGFDRDESREQRRLVRQELLHAQMATAAAQVRLDRRSKDEANRTERERLADDVAAREAEAKFLRAELERLQPKQSPDLKSIDLSAERSEIAFAEEMARQIGIAVEEAQLELNAPDRVRLLSRAKPGGAGSRWRLVLAGW